MAARHASIRLDAVIDRVSVTGDPAKRERVREALEKSFYLGAGRARVVRAERRDGIVAEVASIDLDRRFNCSQCGTPFPDPTPALFSSNSPIGACSECEGFGRTVELDLEKVIPNPHLSLRQGLIAPWRTPAYHEMSEWMIKLAPAGERFLHRGVVTRDDRRGASLAHRRLTRTAGLQPRSNAKNSRAGQAWSGVIEFDEDRWPGVRGFFRWLEGRRYKTHVRILLAKYRRFVTNAHYALKAAAFKPTTRSTCASMAPRLPRSVASCRSMRSRNGSKAIKGEIPRHRRMRCA